MQTQNSAQRFGLNAIPFHRHTGLDSPRINSAHITPGLKTSGSVTMSSEKDYRFNVNFTPSSVLFYGIAVNSISSPTYRAFVVGQAALGQNLYFQPGTTSSVTVGGKREIVQSSTMISYSNSSGAHTIADEGHIVDVEDSSVIARATISSYGQNFFIVTVETLSSGWSIIGNWFVS